MSRAVKGKSAGVKAGSGTVKRGRVKSPKGQAGMVPAPVTIEDKIVLEIRKFIAASIFFNTQTAEKVGIGLTDMQMLHMLQLYGPSTPSKLTGLSSGGVTVALDRLEKAEYVRREANPGDRRSLLVVLVPARLQRMAGLYDEVERETRRQLGTLPQRDLEAVVRFFETMGKVRAERKEPTKAKG